LEYPHTLFCFPPDKLELKVHDFVKEKEVADVFGIDKIPALVLEGARPNKIHFYGIPTGYEFVTLLEDLLDVSRGSTDLKPETLEALRGLKKPVHLRVFVTPI
jgi:alkyl hydroperoxide reductase subunit AhpF